MSQPFPPLPYLSGNFAPILMECDAHDLPVTGELPRALHGTLYRNGPNPQFAPRDPYYHWFIGDGMVHAFHIEDGCVRYRNRWVRTNKFNRERAAGRALFGSWGNPATTDPSVAGEESGVANTNIVWHAGRLLALEEADLPVELDAGDLATRGDCTYGGKLSGPMTAHPKIDPVTGELVFFAYSADGPFTEGLRYGVVDGDGRLTRLAHFDAPFSSMIHDFMVTPRHVLFPVLPLTGSMARAMRGEPAYAWEPQLGAHIGIMPRHGDTAQIRWFRGEACYVFHVMNAWEEGNRILADVMQYDEPPVFNPNAGGPGSRARLCRWTFDLDAGTDAFQSTWLDDMPGEFPRIDDRFATLPYRHGYFASRQHEGSLPGTYDTLVHLDAATGQRTLHALPEGDAISEPVFVPRKPDSAEGDGWLLATVFRGGEQRSDLVVYEAGDISRGPVAAAQLSHRVPFGFHGNWRPAQ
ncbi:Lignostilbene-alpha,beta-dioxygenase isozyme I [Cupriavidus laharis]|uniref:Lignostilbene-alpha,beta-dioxygenase isozyme I n=1 Tax=Cupriavidus laharis TaxID=151654 RepID=A0ABM8XY22_9BURK|nr:carotenoid oxygenase family protein [Cupriavidus laharis]CAG9185297.1 Lignostilbene-alpha,beta-dioxygenase isozyme I [Cupriavidus laharis]